MRTGTMPVAPTPADFERIGRDAPTRLPRRAAEALLGERLREDLAEYRITTAGRDLRVEHFAEAAMTRPFWVIWLPDGSGVAVYDWRWEVRFEEQRG